MAKCCPDYVLFLTTIYNVKTEKENSKREFDDDLIVALAAIEEENVNNIYSV